MTRVKYFTDISAIYTTVERAADVSELHRGIDDSQPGGDGGGGEMRRRMVWRKYDVTSV